ncbi:EamA family transporter [Thermopolyspora sp. NPDC052614]|uniref:DMT family transporter n=1 Tax=Thermopolyspora sp. NPDC052614 TaxID=3155682 RepID=UPI00341343DB
MSRRGWVLFALMSVIWGIPYLMIKVAVEEVSAPVLVFARTAVGAAILMPLAVRAGGLGVLRRHWKPLVLFAVIEMMVPWLLLTDAERHLSSSMAGLLVAAVPIIAVVVGKIAGDRERLGPLRWIGLLVGFAGVALLAAPHLTGGGFWPIVELFIVALGYATAPLLAARKLANVPSMPMTAACLSLAALVYAPAAILTWPAAMPSGQALAAIGGLAVICTVLAFLVFFELIREVGPARATVFTYVNPAVAVVAGVVFLGEPLTPAIVAAFALILGGSVLATSRGSATARGTARRKDTPMTADRQPT